VLLWLVVASAWVRAAPEEGVEGREEAEVLLTTQVFKTNPDAVTSFNDRFHPLTHETTLSLILA
jgi:hypothetical protein